MSAIIHFINLYAQSGGQDAFVRDWMAAACCLSLIHI